MAEDNDKKIQYADVKPYAKQLSDIAANYGTKTLRGLLNEQAKCAEDAQKNAKSGAAKEAAVKEHEKLGEETDKLIKTYLAVYKMGDMADQMLANLKNKETAQGTMNVIMNMEQKILMTYIKDAGNEYEKALKEANKAGLEEVLDVKKEKEE